MATAQILHHRVGLEHVGTDLVAPGDFAFGAVKLFLRLVEFVAFDLDGRVGLVDVLPPCPAGTERVDPQVFFVDLHLDVIVHFRGDVE